MNGIVFEALHEELGARVLGVDLVSGLRPDIVQSIREALDTWSLLCFPDQAMDDDAHLALTRRLGEPEAEHVTLGSTGKVVYFGTVGNIAEDGSKQDAVHPRTLYQTGNELWHSDSSFRAIPTLYSINHAYEVPGEGGGTCFASMRSAWDRLPRERQEEIEPLQVIHDYVFSRTQVAPVNPAHAASLPPVVHRLVRRNPANGRKNYYVGSHARSVVGWACGAKSRELLDDLIDRATSSEHVYTHLWRAGDTVIWDNRCLLHRGAGYDANRWRRRMRQTRVCGAGPTLDE